MQPTTDSCVKVVSPFVAFIAILIALFPVGYDLGVALFSSFCVGFLSPVLE